MINTSNCFSCIVNNNNNNNNNNNLRHTCLFVLSVKYEDICIVDNICAVMDIKLDILKVITFIQPPITK